MPGDRVLVDRGAYWLRAPRPGDLLAIIGDDGRLRVKRLAARGGDRVSLAGASLQVNGRPIAAVIGADAAWLPVHDDTFRRSGQSRWQHGEAWTLTPHGFRWHPPASHTAAEWLIYQHLAVHDDLRPDRVRDDDPGNAAVSRRLANVDDLRLTGRIVASGPTTIEVAFWHSDGIRCVHHPVSAGTHRWTVETGKAPAAGILPIQGRDAPPPVTAERPVAVRLRGPAATLDRLRLMRPVQWSVDAADARHWKQPTTVAAGRYFVLGDNQPVSVDSRSDPRGVAANQIIGRVIPWERSAATARSD